MNIATKLFFHILVVWYLFEEAHAGARRSMLQCSTLNQLNKTPVKSIKSPDGDIVDCVRICHQPGLNHPLLKNHTIMMRPNYYPNWMKDNDIKVSSMKNVTKNLKKGIAQLWHSSGKCPKGTIPIRRTKKEDLSIESYHKKKRYFVAQSRSNDSQLYTGKYDVTGHEYATATTQGPQFFGTKATFNVWNPMTEVSSEFSLTQLWIVAGPQSGLNTIEAGWQVFPGKYGDTNTRLFIFHTNDGYDQTVCYNLECGEESFIQTNNNILIGGSITPTSQVDDSQYEITIYIFRDPSQGIWWMTVNNDPVGYWPATRFSYLSESAESVQWGGEIIDDYINGYHTSTQMGSGQFPEAGYGKASYIKNIQIVDESMNLRTPGYFTTMATNKNCYDILIDNNAKSGVSFFYGGPGRNQECM